MMDESVQKRLDRIRAQELVRIVQAMIDALDAPSARQ